MRSDVLFSLTYVLLWVGLFAMARKGVSRLIVVVLFHGVTIIVALIATSAYQYFKVTGSTLDAGYLYLWYTSPAGTWGAIASELTPGLVVLILLIFAYAVVGPLLVTRLVTQWRGWRDGDDVRVAEVSWLRVFGVGLATYALFSFSLLPGGMTKTDESRSFARNFVVNVVVTGIAVAESEELPSLATDTVAEGAPPPATQARFVPTGAERRNVVLILLESTRAMATTPYNQGLDTTPFMDELAKRSLLVERV